MHTSIRRQYEKRKTRDRGQNRAASCWADLGSPELGPELQKKIVNGVLEEVDGRSLEALSQERDALILGLLELLSHREQRAQVAK